VIIPIVFVTVSYTSITVSDAENKIDMETGINILLDADELDIKRIFKYISRLHFNFIFSLSDNLLKSNNMDALLPDLYLLFTLSASFRKCQNRIPVLQASNEALSRLQEIRNYFSLQGEQHLGFTLFNETNSSVQNNTLLLNSNDLSMLDDKQVNAFLTQKPDQLILLDNAASINAINQENPYAKLLLKIIALTNDQSWNLHRSALWQKRANLYLSFIALGKKVGEQEYYDLKTWYHDEYEVLPLWYKRMGHIIKVLKGKRSFRSLFTDNIKKKGN
jgi:hypothetical protein